MGVLQGEESDTGIEKLSFFGGKSFNIKTDVDFFSTFKQKDKGTKLNWIVFFHTWLVWSNLPSLVNFTQGVIVSVDMSQCFLA
jgi:hypothetical protein